MNESIAPAELILFPQVRIVLVETTHPGNIGAVARAMKNMGIHRLVLINPKQFPHDKAIWRSANAVDIIEAARVVTSLDEAIADCQLVIGTSARHRRIPWPLLEPKACGIKVALAQRAGHEVAIMFGREAHGLRNKELQKCHFHVNIPTGKAYSSLNLAMAVQIITYEILQASLNQNQDKPAWDMAYADNEAMQHFFDHLERILIAVDFHDPANPRQLMTRLRRMFNRIRPDKMEINILRGFLTAVSHQKSSTERK